MYKSSKTWPSAVSEAVSGPSLDVQLCLLWCCWVGLPMGTSPMIQCCCHGRIQSAAGPLAPRLREQQSVVTLVIFLETSIKFWPYFTICSFKDGNVWTSKWSLCLSTQNNLKLSSISEIYYEHRDSHETWATYTESVLSKKVFLKLATQQTV